MRGSSRACTSVEMPATETIRKLVERDMGVAFLPRMCVEQEIDQKRLCAREGAMSSNAALSTEAGLELCPGMPDSALSGTIRKAINRTRIYFFGGRRGRSSRGGGHGVAGRGSEHAPGHPGRGGPHPRERIGDRKPNSGSLCKPGGRNAARVHAQPGGAQFGSR